MNRVKAADSWVRNPNGNWGYTCNVFTGCLGGCSYCFAREIAARRTRDSYLANDRVVIFPGVDRAAALEDPFWPRFWPERIEEIYKLKTPAGIFLNIMGDWSDPRIPLPWRAEMFKMIRDCSQHKFYLLTKRPDELVLCSFPDNCRVGVSVDVYSRLAPALKALRAIEAGGTFLSMEPLLESMSGPALDLWGIDQVIIGACSGTYKKLETEAGKHPGLKIMSDGSRPTLQPKIGWVRTIVYAAEKTGTKVFLKENLKRLLLDHANDKSLVVSFNHGESEFDDLDLSLRQETI